MVKKGYFFTTCVTIATFYKMAISGNVFFADWVNAYWLMLKAGQSTFPPYFLGPTNNFNPLTPWFLYYGGYPFWLLSKFSLLANVNPEIVFRISWIFLAIFMGISVTYLTNRMVKNNFISSLMGAISVTNTYYISNSFGRGAFTEFIFTSLLPISFALSLKYISSNNQVKKSVYLFLFTISNTLLLTTHTVSIIIFFICTFLGILFWLMINIFTLNGNTWLKKKFYELGKNRGILLSLSASFFFAGPQFFPFILTSSKTIIANQTNSFSAIELTSLGEIFRLTPHTSDFSGTPGLATQLPVLLMVWGLIVTTYMNRRLRRRYLIAPLILFIFYLILLISTNIFWQFLPSLFFVAQFPYRYLTYVSWAIYLLVILLIKEIVSSKLNTSFISIFTLLALISIFNGINQSYNAKTYNDIIKLQDVNVDNSPSTWYADQNTFASRGSLNDVFNDSNFIIISETAEFARIEIICESKEKISLPTFASPSLVSIQGAQIIGTNSTGYLFIDGDICINKKSVQLEISKKMFGKEVSDYNKVFMITGLFLLLAGISEINFKSRKSIIDLSP